jgi:hypothetical protein
MTKLNLNLIPDMLQKKEVTRKEALNLLCEFILSDSPVFGLIKFDEDFISELILRILERGTVIFDSFNPNSGSFFTYFFKYVQSVKFHLLKELSIKELKYKHVVELSKEDLYISDSNSTYYPSKYFIKNEEKNIDEILKNSAIYPKDFLKLIKKHPRGYEKLLLVLALKSSYNITETNLNMIASCCNINKEKLQEIVDYLNDKLEYKLKRKRELEEKRNSVYFYKKKYEHQIKKLNEEVKEDNKYVSESLTEKYNRKYEKWGTLNKKLNNSSHFFKPTNKEIANVLGLCERQVNYYIKALKNINEKENETS